MDRIDSRLGILAGLGLVAVLVLPAAADVVQMKDGHVLNGKVTQEREVLIDPASGQPIAITKASPCFIVDDKVRYTLFNQRQVESTDKDTNIYDGNVVLRMPFSRIGRSRPGEAVIGQATPFNDKWERHVQVTIKEDMAKYAQPGDNITPANRFKIINAKVKQKITSLSPHYIRVECAEYEWQANYLTSEFGPLVVLPLIRSHPEIMQKPADPPDFDKQFTIFRFCTQAGWLDEAQRELKLIKEAFADQKQKLATAETGLRQLIQQRIWRDAELAARAGRHAHVQELLQQLTIAELPAPLQVDAANLKSRYDTLQTKLDQTRRALAVCYGNVFGPPIDFVGQALPVICRELNIDMLDRLEPFAALGRQIELDRKNGRESQYTLDQVLAAAVTGWVLGPTAAEASTAAAERLWSVREQILTIQRTAAPIDRARLTAELERSAGLTIDEIARAITLLPPAEAGAATAGGNPVELRTHNPFSGAVSIRYRLQMPAEYNPNRAYPLLIVLPNAGQTIDNAIAPWEVEAIQNGYILACVEWGGAKGVYEYKPDEHVAVTECLRDIKRFANVDTDRVALAGFGEGANMAIDVGLSHPDLFAAVVPINGRPRAFISSWYWRNAQSLPFYVVLGELTGGVRTWALDLFDKWAGKGYASLLVMYRGRPIEFFPGEVPYIFDWLGRKHRAVGFPDLGRNPGAGTAGEEYHSFRATDNHFYWASTEQVVEKSLMADFLSQKMPAPAAIQATIRDANQITVFTRNLKQLTLWFGRMYDAQTGSRDMIDFAKPIKITLNNRTVWTNSGKPLTPKLETLMEDLYQRNDRRRLFLAKVDFNNIQ
jgi:pimeloyl-ACP methyl ester carboxylesterase